MNSIQLSGIIRDIQPSHTIGDVSYDKANIIVKRDDGKEDILNIRFKSLSNKYKNNDRVDLIGNIRSYSSKLKNGKNKVDIYVFTYFDQTECSLIQDELTAQNKVTIDGRICKIDPIRTFSNRKKNIHFILANNLIVSDNQQKLNSYIPCIAWGNVADRLSKLGVNSKIIIDGHLQSREYKKILDDNSCEIRVAHELYVVDFKEDLSN